MAAWLTRPLVYMSARNIFWGGKGGRCVGLTSLLPSFAECPENLGALDLVQPVQTLTRIDVVTPYWYDPQTTIRVYLLSFAFKSWGSPNGMVEDFVDNSVIWRHVTVQSRIAVFSKGTCVGLNGWIPVGVQVDPSSVIGDNRVWKNAQKNDTKNRMYEKMNRNIPLRRPILILKPECLHLQGSTVPWISCICWRMKDQLDVTCYFISLLMCSTYFGH